MKQNKKTLPLNKFSVRPIERRRAGSKRVGRDTKRVGRDTKRVGLDTKRVGRYRNKPGTIGSNAYVATASGSTLPLCLFILPCLGL